MRYVPANCIRPGQHLAMDLKMYDNRVYLRNRVVFTEPLIQKIRLMGFQGAYIDDDISKDLVVANVISDELKMKAKKEIKSLFLDLEHNNIEHLNQNMKTIELVIQGMVEQIVRNRRTMVNIVDLRTFDDYTYSHSLNVAVLAVVMGSVLCLNKKMLQELAISALIHDIGKLFINKNIVIKPDKLTTEEYSEMKQHSEKGYEYLRKYNRLSGAVMNGIMDHHERYNGEGYPKGLSGDHISLYGRIICVADVYDALTSDRPYRRAILPSDAIEYIMSQYCTMFDPDVVDVFIQKVAPYPVGTCVTLSNGTVGIVVENHEGCGLRPVLRVIEDGEATSRIIDLNEDGSMLNVTITEVLKM